MNRPIVVAGIALFALGCSVREAEPVMSVSSSDPQSEFDAAQSKLEALLGEKIESRGGDANGTPGLKSKPQDSGGTTALSSGGSCENACSALASMRRAAERVCSLDSSRCSEVRERVTAASDRVRAHCGECD